jgi:hypothetical protein
LFNPFFTSFLLLSLLLSSSFFFYFTCKLLFGPLSSFLNPLPFFLSSSPHGPPLKHSTLNNFDLSKLDFFILLPFLFFTFLFAFFPTPLISLLSLPLLLISSS